MRDVSLEQVLALIKPEFQEEAKKALLYLKDNYVKSSDEEKDKALDNLVNYVWHNEKTPVLNFENIAVDPSEDSYFDPKGLANIAIDYVVPVELYYSEDPFDLD